MKRVLFLFCITLFSLGGFAQKKDSIINYLQSEIEVGNHNQHIKDSITYELTKELLQYTAKEDYIANALSEQSTWYSLIVGAILIIFTTIGLITIYFEKKSIVEEVGKKFKIQNSKITELLKRQNEKVKKQSEFSNEILNKLNITSANNNHTIALISIKDEKYVEGLAFSLNSAFDNSELKELNPIIINASLMNVEKCIDFATVINDQKKTMLRHREGYLIMLDKISEIDNSDTKDLCAIIRLKLNELK